MNTLNYLHLAVATGLALALSSFASAQTPASTEPVADLFFPIAGAKDPMVGRIDSIQRSRPVHVDFQMLRDADVGDVYRVELFKSLALRVKFERKEIVECEAGAYNWHGSIIGRPGATFIFSVVRDGFCGSLDFHDPRYPGRFMVQGAPGMHCVRLLNAKGRRCGNDHSHVVTTPNQGSPSGVCDDDKWNVRVLMVYGNVALNQAGSHTKIKAACQNGIASASLAFQLTAASPIQANKLKLIPAAYRHMNHTIPSGTSMSDSLTHLSRKKDATSDPKGYMDYVHSWRITDNADLVAWAMGNMSSHGNTIGMAWRPGSTTSFKASKGFSVNEWDDLVSERLLAHEIGHNFGCSHDPSQTSSGVFSYSFGFRKRWKNSWPNRKYVYTNMAYYYDCASGWSCNHNLRNHFSDPRIVWKDGNGNKHTLGSSTQNNARSIRDTQQYVANYSYDLRGYDIPPVITQQPQNATLCYGFVAPGQGIMSVVGTGATRYQWRRNGANIAGQTSALLTIPSSNVTAATAGSYDCILSGLCFSTTSTAATLSVTSTCRRGLIRFGANGNVALDIVGDANGDGYRDFAIGQFRINNNAGQVQLISGKTHKAISGSIGGLVANDEFGYSVTGGDLNGDGKAEVIAGAPGRNSGNGAVYVRWGHTNAWQRYWTGVNEFGTIVETASLTADSRSDVVVADKSTKLVALDGASKATLWTRTMISTVRVVRNVGDVNKDGRDDLAIGMPGYRTSKGRIEVLSGKSGATIYTIDGSVNNTRVGSSIATFGMDMNGDGIPEFASGSPGHSSNKGLVTIRNGRTGAALIDVIGTVAQGQFGHDLSGPADFDKDGKADVFVGSPAYYSSGADGAAYMISGATRKVMSQVLNRGNWSFGTQVAFGDINGDGQADRLVVQTNSDAKGVWIWDAPAKVGPARVAPYGTTCPDSKGRLPRGEMGLTQPRVGGKTTLVLRAAPPSSTTFLHIGALRNSTSLAFLDMPGCVWNVQMLIDAALPTNAQGRVDFTVSVPNNSSLVGSKLMFQWFPIDNAITGKLPVVASNGVEFQIGAK